MFLRSRRRTWDRAVEDQVVEMKCGMKRNAKNGEPEAGRCEIELQARQRVVQEAVAAVHS